MGRFREVVEGLRAPPCTFPTQTGAQGALERQQPTLSMLLEEELDPPKISENRLECANIVLGVEKSSSLCATYSPQTWRQIGNAQALFPNPLPGTCLLYV